MSLVHGREHRPVAVHHVAGNRTELGCIEVVGKLAREPGEQLFLLVVLGQREVPEHHAQLDRFLQLGAIIASLEKRLDEAHHLRGRALAAILRCMELGAAVEDTHWQIATTRDQQRLTAVMDDPRCWRWCWTERTLCCFVFREAALLVLDGRAAGAGSIPAGHDPTVADGSDGAGNDDLPRDGTPMEATRSPHPAVPPLPRVAKAHRCLPPGRPPSVREIGVVV
jgi:hypothetical protein